MEFAYFKSGFESSSDLRTTSFPFLSPIFFRVHHPSFNRSRSRDSKSESQIRRERERVIMEKITEAFSKVKNHQAVERMKMLVGMEVDEESSTSTAPPADDTNSYAFMDDFNRSCTLSTTQRIQGFAICFVAGLTCTFLSLLVFFNPIKFGIAFTFGNLLSIGSTAFLIGPKRQITMMLDPVRIYATALYLASMIIALFCALYVHSKILTLFAITLELGALTWYSLSYIPFARTMVTKVFVALFDTEF